ncbi:hypothetical protein JCM31598_24670 [Desulfonatronum parangueonense]
MRQIGDRKWPQSVTYRQRAGGSILRPPTPFDMPICAKRCLDAVKGKSEERIYEKKQYLLATIFEGLPLD